MQENLTQEMLSKINTFSKKELTFDEVYCFPIILCDNEIDRDNERFSLNALNCLSKMFIGKTGIKDHNPKSSNQTARIFETSIITDQNKKTSTGENYTYLKAYAYMIRTSKNEYIIKEIEAGIKKEVSISCSVSKAICSVCKADTKTSACSHRKGKIYNGNKCHIILDEPTDAYEWSFVAVPAQKNAGVTKKAYGENNFDEISIKQCDYDLLVSKANENSTQFNEVKDYLRKEIIKLSFACYPQMQVKTISRLAENMEISELIFIKNELEKTYSSSKHNEPLTTKQANDYSAFSLK